MVYVIKNNLPLIGGATGSVISGSELPNTITMITLNGCIEVMLYAFLGAVIGYITKLLFDYLIKKYKNKK